MISSCHTYIASCRQFKAKDQVIYPYTVPSYILAYTVVLYSPELLQQSHGYIQGWIRLFCMYVSECVMHGLATWKQNGEHTHSKTCEIVLWCHCYRAVFILAKVWEFRTEDSKFLVCITVSSLFCDNWLLLLGANSYCSNIVLPNMCLLSIFGFTYTLVALIRQSVHHRYIGSVTNWHLHWTFAIFQIMEAVNCS